MKAEFRVVGESEPVTAAGFTKLIRDQAAALADAPKTGNEGAAMRVTPGAFIPTCPDHETLTDNPQVYTVRIRTGTGTGTGAGANQSLSMFDVLQNWLSSYTANKGTGVEVLLIQWRYRVAGSYSLESAAGCRWASSQVPVNMCPAGIALRHV